MNRFDREIEGALHRLRVGPFSAGVKQDCSAATYIEF
jgi:hypothetical protein